MVPISEAQFKINLERVLERIHLACEQCGRSTDSVQLLPVTKTHPPELVAYAQRAGFQSVGENKVQEAAEKQPHSPSGVEWELIGHLQSNKTKQAAELFTRIQSVDSVKLLRRLNEAAAARPTPLHVLLQINTANDPGKFGAEPSEAEVLLTFALQQPNLVVDGLMTIGPLDGGLDATQATFESLRKLKENLEQHCGQPLPELSMGMTGDLEVAIAEGSTLIRVGTALFGLRE